MNRNALILLGKLCCVLIPIAITGCSKDNPVSVNMVNKYRADIEEVREQVQRSRDLNFLSKIKVGSITREQYGNRYTFYPYAEALMVTFKQLGYLPDTLTSLEKILIDYNAGFPAAYYTHGSDSVTLVESDITRARFRGLIAHEFTHALQDQNFNIGGDAFLPSITTSIFNSDFYIARTSMVEGDAEIQELKFQSNITSVSAIVDTFETRSKEYLEYINRFQFPGYLRVRSYFPYYMGALRIALLYQNGGWNAVNSIFHTNRILSTAEVLTGEKFEPVNFSVSDITKEWTENSIKIQFADDDNYGAVMIMALLSDYVDIEQCKRAFGWCGDRLIYMRSNDEQWGKMVWSFAFKENNDAIYIMKGLDRVLQTRKLNGASPSKTFSIPDSLVNYTTGNVKTSLIRSGKYLFWIENMNNPQTVASNIINSTLSKRDVADNRIKVSSEMTTTKRALLNCILNK